MLNTVHTANIEYVDLKSMNFNELKELLKSLRTLQHHQFNNYKLLENSLNEEEYIALRNTYFKNVSIIQKITFRMRNIIRQKNKASYRSTRSTIKNISKEF